MMPFAFTTLSQLSHGPNLLHMQATHALDVIPLCHDDLNDCRAQIGTAADAAAMRANYLYQYFLML